MLKLGGSVITDKSGHGKFRKPATKRLTGELAKVQVPCVLFHGAGSFGHPEAAKHALGRRQAKTEGVAEVLARAGALHAHVVEVAAAAGLKPLSFPIHLSAVSEGGRLHDLPVERIHRALEDGFTPVLGGTLVRDDEWGWRVASADEQMAELAHDLDPRLAVFCTDVDGVYGDGGVMAVCGPEHLDDLAVLGAQGDDVTGRMNGKLERAFQIAGCCPTWIISGEARGRLFDVLRGKPVLGTRIQV